MYIYGSGNLKYYTRVCVLVEAGLNLISAFVVCFKFGHRNFKRFCAKYYIRFV
jgi:hypothetical protein